MKGAGVAFTITLLALVLYAAIVFLGLEYIFNGVHWQAISVTAVGCIIIGLCIYYARHYKTIRSKREGRPREVALIAVAIIVLFVGSIPFTMFTNMYFQRNVFVTTIAETAHQVNSIDSCYKEYVNHRVESYKKYLESNTRHYYGWSDDIKLKTYSLERRLFPRNLDSICRERKEWLATLDSVSIFNLSTAKNLHRITNAGSQWVKQYRNISNFYYEGENTTAFAISDYHLVANSKYAQLSTPKIPGFYSILSVLFCVIWILIYYWSIPRPRNQYTIPRR